MLAEASLDWDLAGGGNVLDADWQRFWFSTLTDAARPWTSLTLMASGGSADLTTVAERIAAVAREHGVVDVTVLAARGIAAAEVPGLIARLTAFSAEGTRVIVAADSPAENPAIIPLIRATSAVLLVVRIGESTVQANREMVDAIDRSKIIGSIVIS
jgi:hypothetical protein